MNSLKKCFNILLIICIFVSLCACGSSPTITGNWVCQEVNEGYPDQMTLYDDGTGMIDGYSCNWAIEDGTITFNIGDIFIGTQSYEYKISGSALYLDDYGYNKK